MAESQSVSDWHLGLSPKEGRVKLALMEAGLKYQKSHFISVFKQWHLNKSGLSYGFTLRTGQCIWFCARSGPGTRLWLKVAIGFLGLPVALERVNNQHQPCIWLQLLSSPANSPSTYARKNVASQGICVSHTHSLWYFVSHQWWVGHTRG